MDHRVRQAVESGHHSANYDNPTHDCSASVADGRSVSFPDVDAQDACSYKSCDCCKKNCDHDFPFVEGHGFKAYVVGFIRFVRWTFTDVLICALLSALFVTYGLERIVSEVDKGFTPERMSAICRSAGEATK